MNLTTVILTDDKGNRDAQVTIDAVEVGLTVAFKADARSCRVLIAQLTKAAEELEKVVVIPPAVSLCGACSGTLKGFKRTPVKTRGGMWLHFADSGAAYYECRFPPRSTD